MGSVLKMAFGSWSDESALLCQDENVKNILLLDLEKVMRIFFFEISYKEILSTWKENKEIKRRKDRKKLFLLENSRD